MRFFAYRSSGSCVQSAYCDTSQKVRKIIQFNASDPWFEPNQETRREKKALSQGDGMLKHIKAPTVVKAQGNKPKLIEEFVGRMNTQTQNVSIARMKSPGGWFEPGQTPEFDEYTIVLRGIVRVKTAHKTIDVKEGEAAFVKKNEWVQYSTPLEEGAEYIAVCVPAFSAEIVHRDEK
jgi:mannose-6-phosphate isomerase-like protein (cupin superfamily)